MIISIIFIVVLLALLVVQHVWHQSVLKDKKYEHNMSLERVHDVLANEWIKGTVASVAYHPLVKAIDEEHQDV